MSSVGLPITEADLQAYADGLLPEARRLEVEAWLTTHHEEAERLAAYRRFDDEMRAVYDPVLGEPVPQRLSRTARWRARLRRSAAVGGWLAAGLLIGVIGGWQMHSLRQPVVAGPGEPPPLARRAATAHATYSPEVRHPVEVGVEQEAHLVAWLSKRVGSPLRAPHLEGVGYYLMGGRLLPGESGPTAQFMYQCKQGTRVTLYVRNEPAAGRETSFLYSQEGKVGVFYWIDRKLGYAVSSADITKETLLSVANAAYQQLNPP